MTRIGVGILTALCMVGVAVTAEVSFAQSPKVDAPKADASKINLSALQMIPLKPTISTLEKIDGYYTYKANGALVAELGAKVIYPVDLPLPPGIVQFRPCGIAQKIPVDQTELHATKRTCGKGGGIWLTKIGDALVPVLNDSTDVNLLAGKKIDLSTFPADYQALITNKKGGELVAHSVKTETGDLTLSVFTRHQM